jgi:hypothetical protein
MPSPRARRARFGRIITQRPERAAMVRTGPRTAAPSRFTAWLEVKTPAMQVAVDVLLEAGAVPVIEQFAIRPVREPITAALLRKVSLDQIIPAAVKAASVPVTERGDIAPGAFQIEGDENSNQVRVSAPKGTDERVIRAAQFYREALAAGSRSPAVATAKALHLSREHTARYIRRARAAGLLPPVRDVVSGKSPARPRPAPQPSTPPGWTPIRLRDLSNPETWTPDGSAAPDRQTGQADSPTGSTEEGMP